MNANVAQLLKAAANDLDIDLNVLPKYSGRGMFGQTTCAIVVHGQAHLRITFTYVMQISAKAAAMLEDARLLSIMDKKPQEGLTVDDFVLALGALQFDNMGLDTVVY